MKVGNRGPRAPLEGRRRRAAQAAGGNDGSAGALTNHLHKTPAACRAGAPVASDGVHDAGAPDRRGPAAGGVASDPGGRGAGDRRGDRPGGCGAPRGQPGQRARAAAPWAVACAARPAPRSRPGGRQATPERYSSLRGQARPAGGGQAVGSALRAGLLGWLSWLS
jgi:hypothetical protein